VIDFQEFRGGSLALDLNHFFFHTFVAYDSPEYEEYVEYYYIKLTQLLSVAKIRAPFTLKELFKEIKAKKMFAFIMLMERFHQILGDLTTTSHSFNTHTVAQLEEERELYFTKPENEWIIARTFTNMFSADVLNMTQNEFIESCISLYY